MILQRTATSATNTKNAHAEHKITSVHHNIRTTVMLLVTTRNTTMKTRSTEVLRGQRDTVEL